MKVPFAISSQPARERALLEFLVWPAAMFVSTTTISIARRTLDGLSSSAAFDLASSGANIPPIVIVAAAIVLPPTRRIAAAACMIALAAEIASWFASGFNHPLTDELTRVLISASTALLCAAYVIFGVAAGRSSQGDALDPQTPSIGTIPKGNKNNRHRVIPPRLRE